MLPRSFMEIQNQILGAAVDIIGTPFALYYSSDRSDGRQAAYTRTIPVSGSHVAANLQQIELEIAIAGKSIIKNFPPQPNQTYTFVWDGKDAEGKILSGKQPVTIRTTYIYPQPEHNQTKEGTTTLGTWNAIAQGLGGWTFNVHHAYDIAGKTLYLGNGQRRNVEAISTVDDIAIPSEGGGQLYIFDNTGRHLRTISTLTKGLIYQFDYDDSGYLKAITDGDNNITQIERKSKSLAMAIIAPYSQQTKLNFNPDGYLETIINPANESSKFSYTQGLLTSFTDLKGNIYQFEYDELGRLKSRQEPDGSFELLARKRTEKGFEVAKITATGRESTYLTERLSNGKERQVNKGCGGIGAIVAVTDKNGADKNKYVSSSSKVNQQNDACAQHDIDISESGVPWYEINNPKIIEANRALANNSTFPKMRSLFNLLADIGENTNKTVYTVETTSQIILRIMSLPTLPNRIVSETYQQWQNPYPQFW